MKKTLLLTFPALALVLLIWFLVANGTQNASPANSKHIPQQVNATAARAADSHSDEPAAIRKNALEDAMNLIAVLRLRVASAKSPGDYSPLVARLAYILDANRKDARLWKELLEIIKGDQDKKIRMLIAIAYGFEGDTKRKLELGELLLKEKDPEVMLALFHAIRSPDPLHYKPPSGRYEGISFDPSSEAQYALYVQDMLLPIESFYGTRDAIERDYKIEEKYMRNPDGSYYVGSEWMSYFGFSYYEPEIGRLLLQFASDQSVPKEIRLRVLGDLGTFPESFPEGFVDDVFYTIKTTDDYFVGIHLVNHVISLYTRAFDKRWEETVRNIADYYRRLDRTDVRKHENLSYFGRVLAHYLARPERYDYALSFLQDNPDLKNMDGVDVQKEIEMTILGFPIRGQPGDYAWGVQKRILISRRDGDIATYAFFLTRLGQDLEGFAVSEAKRLLATEKDHRIRLDLTQVIQEHGTIEDIKYLESLVPIDKEDEVMIYARTQNLKSRLRIK